MDAMRQFEGAVYQAVCGIVSRLLRDVAAVMGFAETDALAHLDFPAGYRRRMRTNNVQDRMNREIERRSRVVQVFSSAESMLRLMGAICAEQDEGWSSRRYISSESTGRLSESAAPAPLRARSRAEGDS